MPYVTLISVALGIVKTGLDVLTHANAPKDVIDALQASYAAVEAHRNDALTKANFEAQRG